MFCESGVFDLARAYENRMAMEAEAKVGKMDTDREGEDAMTDFQR